ncbi:uncharacterized protein KY384_003349 [Bacidia gigantensis]|uniref:uncharacterized protein n=1 Tax=Bacidia gigantensis TaxID=2732470 RepID=UPI001D03EC20|nr:uncharacterized protein KY384_003349 [Bacidia gigantensis]KAG8531717.1 hypothetical protein KY384_003349 [Bacidia gigantensis]
MATPSYEHYPRLKSPKSLEFISVSSIIGVTIFYSDGEALEVAGPSGALLAFGIVGVIAICVMECVSELIQMFPTPNAIVEFVRVFVDEDLSWVIGVAYWYTWSSIFATQIIAAAAFTNYWGFAQVYQTVFMYFLTPVLLLAINLCGVFWFGWIETIGGLVKIGMVFGTAVFMYNIHRTNHIGSKFIAEGFTYNPAYAMNANVAGCFVIPLISYGFLGVEMISVTAFEARDLVSLKRPSQMIAYFILALYLFVTLSEFMNVKWTNDNLPDLFGAGGKDSSTYAGGTRLRSHAIVVIAALEARYKHAPGILNAFMIYSTLSAANSALYISSRTLHGMTLKIKKTSRISIFRGLGSVWQKTGVPMRALGVSCGAFVWLPFLQLRRGIAVAEVAARNNGGIVKRQWPPRMGLYLPGFHTLLVLGGTKSSQSPAWYHHAMGKRQRRRTADEVTSKIQRSIKKCFHQSNSNGERFICKRGLQSVWTDHQVESIPAFKAEGFNGKDYKVIKERFLVVLSIVIFIDWDNLEAFREVFVEQKLDDNALFFNEDQLRGLRGGKDNFLTQQYLFRPTVIEERSDCFIQNIPSDHRLPFISEPERLGEGGYGAVTKRYVAVRCLKEGDKDNSEPVAVACKEYFTDRPQEDFEREVHNLNFLKESLRESRCVMRHLAAIVHGPKFLILLPLAKYFNLEVFLRDGKEPVRTTQQSRQRYCFVERFPHLNHDGHLHRAIVKQAYGLSDALLWLHRDLRIFERKDCYLAHMDLKPENILIDGDPHNPDTPAGEWMLSDFGISAFNKMSNEKVSQTPAIRDFVSRVTSQAPSIRVQRGHGPYQPPEVALERDREASTSRFLATVRPLDGRKCDVWSFACILSDLLAFALERGKGRRRLQKARSGTADDNFYSFTSLPEENVTTITAKNTEIKKGVVGWRRQIAETHPSTWVVDYTAMLENVMKPCPLNRPNIEVIVDCLLDIGPKMVSVGQDVQSTNSQLLQIPGWHLPHVPQPIGSPQSGRSSIAFADEPTSQSIQPATLEPADLVIPTGQSHVPSPSPQIHTRTSVNNDSAVGSSQSSSGTMASQDNSNSTQNIRDQNGVAHPSTTVIAQPSLNATHRIQHDRDFRACETENLHLPKEAHIKTVALNVTGTSVAVLFEGYVQVFSTASGAFLTERITPSSQGHWSKVRLADPFLALYGKSTSHEKHHKAEIYDITTPVKRIFPDSAYHKVDPLLDLLLSKNGVAASIYLRRVAFDFLHLKQTIEIQIPDDLGDIQRGAFGYDGRYLFVWTVSAAAGSAIAYEVRSETLSSISELDQRNTNQQRGLRHGFYDAGPYQVDRIADPACQGFEAISEAVQTVPIWLYGPFTREMVREGAL